MLPPFFAFFPVLASFFISSLDFSRPLFATYTFYFLGGTCECCLLGDGSHNQCTGVIALGPSSTRLSQEVLISRVFSSSLRLLFFYPSVLRPQGRLLGDACDCCLLGEDKPQSNRLGGWVGLICRLVHSFLSPYDHLFPSFHFHFFSLPGLSCCKMHLNRVLLGTLFRFRRNGSGCESVISAGITVTTVISCVGLLLSTNYSSYTHTKRWSESYFHPRDGRNHGERQYCMTQ